MSTRPAIRLLERLGAALATERDAAEATARDAARLIRRRTRRGVDARGRRLRGYAASTRRRKARRGQPTAPATLTDSRRMLDRLKVTTRGFRSTRGSLGRARVVGGTTRDKRLLRIHVSDEPRKRTQNGPRIPQRDIRGVSTREGATLRRLYRGRLLRVVRQTTVGVAA
ncbi:MAG: hypothetical protein AAFN13_15315 [Bacteroidota bacterium]